MDQDQNLGSRGSFNTERPGTTKAREVSGLLKAMNVYGLAEGIILLQDAQEHTFEENGKVIRVMPYGNGC